MIPYSWFFIGWVVFVFLFGLAALLTLATTMRYGRSCSSTYLVSGLFILVSMAVIFLTLSYAASLDLSQGIGMTSAF